MWRLAASHTPTRALLPSRGSQCYIPLISPLSIEPRNVSALQIPTCTPVLHRYYSSKSYSKNKPRNTYGSNEYRSKRHAERLRRAGHAPLARDVPIQFITDQWDNPNDAYAPPSSTPLHTTNLSRDEAKFPNFGRNYKPKASPQKLTETIDFAEFGLEEPAPETDSSSAVPQGGAFGRADAYRVPGQRYGGSYKNPDSYSSKKKIKQRKEKRENEEHENDDDYEDPLQKQWEEEDRLKELELQRQQKPAQQFEKPQQHSSPPQPEQQQVVPEPSFTPKATPAAPAAPAKRHEPISQPSASADALPQFEESFETWSASGQSFQQWSKSAPMTQSSVPTPSSRSKSSIHPSNAATSSSTSSSSSTPSSPFKPRDANRVTWDIPMTSSVPKQDAVSFVESTPEVATEPKPIDTLLTPSSAPPAVPSVTFDAGLFRIKAAADGASTEVSGSSPSSAGPPKKLKGGRRFKKEQERLLALGVDPSAVDAREEGERLREIYENKPISAPLPPSTLSCPASDFAALHATPTSTSSPSSATSPKFIPPPTAALCCGCGAAFQSRFQDSPGFLPEANLKRFVERRTAIYKQKLVEEQRKLMQEEHRARVERIARTKQQQQREPEKTETVKPGHSNEANTVDAEAEVVSDGAPETTGYVPKTPVEGFVPPTSTHWSHALDPAVIHSAKLDVKKPLNEQDLGLALNHGLVDEDFLIEHGIDSSDLIMTKRELNQLERAERDKIRDNTGDSALRCLRCFQLANYGYTKGQVTSVRSEDFRLLLRSRFMNRGGRSSVILKVVDIFDFHGSFIANFSDIVGGRNPIILVVNKIDLMPSGAGENRLRAWIKAEAARYNLHYHSIEMVSATTGVGLRKMITAAQALAEPDAALDRPRRDIYIVGTTNVGKSSIVNALIEKKIITSKGQFEPTQIRAEEMNEQEKARRAEASEALGTEEEKSIYLSAAQFMPTASELASATDEATTTSESSETAASLVDSKEVLQNSFNVLGGKMTASIVPGTTLGMVSFPFVTKYEHDTGAKINKVNHVLFDTPGVINKQQLVHYLTYEELREVMPRRAVQPLTYRLTKGQSLLLGGLARLDFLDDDSSDRDYVFFTVFASRNVTVHITQTSRMDEVAKKKQTAKEESDPLETSAGSLNDEPLEIGYLEFIKKHGGTKIYPPFTPERCREIGLHNGTRMRFELHGRGWVESCEDIVFPGLGWVAITGSGKIGVRAVLPGTIQAYAREPLMPFEAKHTMKKWSGSAVRQH